MLLQFVIFLFSYIKLQEEKELLFEENKKNLEMLKNENELQTEVSH